MTSRGEGERVARLLGLTELPDEGGLFRRTFADAYSSAIYFMLVSPAVSAMHTLTGAETYHWYAGAPLQLLLLYPGGRVERPVLGPDLERGARPQLVVQGGVWQGSRSFGDWTLVGTTNAPPFDRSAFRIGRRQELLAGWPEAADLITALTRA